MIYTACKNSVAELELLKDSITNENRSDVVDPEHAMFLCNKAKVIRFICLCGEKCEHESIKMDKCYSDTMDRKPRDMPKSVWNKTFVYKVGEIVETELDLYKEEGIVYFKTKEAALSRYYICYRHTPFVPGRTGKWTTWYEDGRKEFEGMLKDGKKDGKWTHWLGGNKRIITF